MDLPRELDRFLRQQIFKERDDDKPLTKLVLTHSAPGSKGNIVDSFEIKEGHEPDSIRVLGEEIVSRAQADADGFGGVQRFVLRAYCKGNEREVGRFAFRLRGDDEGDGDGGDEAPTQKGLLTQLMRHNEANNKALVNAVGAITTTLARQLENMGDTVENLLAQRNRDFEMMESLRSQQHARDIEAYQAEQGEKRKNEIFESFKTLAPVLLNKLAGRTVLPANDPTKLMLQGFVETLDSEQLQGIMTHLKPAQAITLVELLQSFQTKQIPEKSS